MKTVFNTYTPEGFSNVNSYLFVSDPLGLIDFLQKAFYAEEISRSINETNGDLSNVILKIGDSCFMLSQARGQFEGMRTAFYLYVEDVDTVYKNALAHGAEVVFEPEDMPYEDRQGGIIDPAGNYWWISKRLVESDY
ncbi:VOC family protein [Flagellimonas sp. CMM7]|uniref:VOC family protein n=1 Tax=Flagellimonas sp. CMM7 TaxID=2654676 RepID=UPI0013D871AF|nr:VOC family protein [Flagellimonas sp. CMM7]UII78376.1 VOC family protein [Flagellimonas sp. CMM7]